MKRFSSAALLFAIALSACTGTNVAPAKPSFPLASAPVAAAPGGSLGTTHGDSVTIAPNILAADQNVTVAFDSNATDTPPNAAWNVAHGVLSIDLPSGAAPANANATYAYTSAPAGM